jgi:hypothetical protein
MRKLVAIGDDSASRFDHASDPAVSQGYAVQQKFVLSIAFFRNHFYMILSNGRLGRSRRRDA